MISPKVFTRAYLICAAGIWSFASGGSILAADNDQPPPPPSQVSSGRFVDWAIFADSLKAQGDRVLAAVPERLRDDPHIQQEVGRLLLAAVATRAIAEIAGDRDHPAFVPWANYVLSPFQPNADTIYRTAIIGPGGTYRLRGRVGSLRILKMWQLAHPIEDAGDTEAGQGAVKSDDFSSLKTDSNGNFDVIVSPQRPAGYTGDWWKLDPSTKAFWLRQVAYDWNTERDPQISIERLDKPVRLPRRSEADLRGRLERVPQIAGNEAILVIGQVEKLRQRGLMNRLAPWASPGGQNLQQLAGFAGQFYYEGAFEIAEDEALILEAKVPKGCQYWSLLLTNDIYENINWYDNQASLNGSQIAVDPDGIMRVVVSAVDPGVPNWLDTAGHLSGAIQGRWTECDATPIPTVKQVKLADLRRNLPAYTPTLSPAQREQIIRDRRARAQQRPLW